VTANARRLSKVKKVFVIAATGMALICIIALIAGRIIVRRQFCSEYYPAVVRGELNTIYDALKYYTVEHKNIYCPGTSGLTFPKTFEFWAKRGQVFILDITY